jgi:hypothetical protein
MTSVDIFFSKENGERVTRGVSKKPVTGNVSFSRAICG